MKGEEFFGFDTKAARIYRAIARRLLKLDGVVVQVSRSQVAFRARRSFAFAWRPGAYVKSDVPVVLSLALPERVDSARFKEIVNPSPTTWMHHVELRLVKDVDRELLGWAEQAYRHAR
ncbi:DUF5655 domain-containing protein [Microbacterium sp. SD291]|uniref:DUF5655 domain-containing protein n=1 Tax=Microbacterium sp. SD291 TaxID=2782007 RepID=UPI001F61F611|nr:DUF5655 domain-containing protein [Microbacterium sp. SD291]